MLLLTSYAARHVMINPPIYPSMVFEGRFLFRGVIPRGIPTRLENKVFIGTQIKGKMTQKIPL